MAILWYKGLIVNPLSDWFHSMGEAKLLLVDNDLGRCDVSKDDGQDDAGQQYRTAHRAHDRNLFNQEGGAGFQTGRMLDQGPHLPSGDCLCTTFVLERDLQLHPVGKRFSRLDVDVLLKNARDPKVPQAL